MDKAIECLTSCFISILFIIFIFFAINIIIRFLNGDFHRLFQRKKMKFKLKFLNKNKIQKNIKEIGRSIEMFSLSKDNYKILNGYIIYNFNINSSVIVAIHQRLNNQNALESLKFENFTPGLSIYLIEDDKTRTTLPLTLSEKVYLIEIIYFKVKSYYENMVKDKLNFQNSTCS